MDHPRVDHGFGRLNAQDDQAAHRVQTHRVRVAVVRLRLRVFDQRTVEGRREQVVVRHVRDLLDDGVLVGAVEMYREQNLAFFVLKNNSFLFLYKLIL